MFKRWNWVNLTIKPWSTQKQHQGGGWQWRMLTIKSRIYPIYQIDWCCWLPRVYTFFYKTCWPNLLWIMSCFILHIYHNITPPYDGLSLYSALLLSSIPPPSGCGKHGACFYLNLPLFIQLRCFGKQAPGWENIQVERSGVQNQSFTERKKKVEKFKNVFNFFPPQ